ncbi:MAG: beta strand repeat-containing protein [Planctomycetota bacterium]
MSTRSPLVLLAPLLLGAACALSGCSQYAGTPLPLTAMAVLTADPSVPLGAQGRFTALGTFEDGSQQDLTAAAAWSIDDPGIAAIAGLVGGEARVTGVAMGTTAVRATVDGVVGTVQVSVTAAALAALAVTPTNPALAAGTQQQFAAMGTYTDATKADLTDQVTWTVSGPAMVSGLVGSEGLVTGLAVGAVTVTATLGAISGDTALTVTAAVLTSLAVTPTAPSIALGTTRQFTAMGTFSDASTQDLTDTVTWSSSVPGVATVGNAPGSEGLAQSIAVGGTTIAATSGAISGSTLLTVSPAVLVSLAVTPTAPSIALGTTQQFAATGTFSDLSTQDLTDAVTWTSSASAVATVGNAPGSEGLAQSAAVGAATITAASGAISGGATLTVTPAVLVSLAVTPAASSIALGTQQQFTATGTYSDSSTQDLTDAVTWSSSAPGVATVGNATGSEGLAQSVATGATTVAAQLGAIADSTSLTVTPAVLVSLAVTPTTPAIAPGAAQQFTATGTYSDSSTQDLTLAVTWSSSASGVATVSNAPGSEGLATAVTAGTTTVTATQGAVSGTATLTVTGVALRAATSAGAAGGLSLTVATPAGAQAGDVLIAAVAVRPDTAVVTPPAGWTLVRAVANSGGAANALHVFRRLATAGEPANHAWSFSSSTGAAAGILAFSGVDTATPIDAEAGQATASALAHAAPGITTTVANTMLVTCHEMTSAATWTPPAGMTEVIDLSSQSAPNAVGISLSMNVEVRSAAGATGTRTATAANDADTGACHALALRSAP